MAEVLSSNLSEPIFLLLFFLLEKHRSCGDVYGKFITIEPDPDCDLLTELAERSSEDFVVGRVGLPFSGVFSGKPRIRRITVPPEVAAYEPEGGACRVAARIDDLPWFSEAGSRQTYSLAYIALMTKKSIILEVYQRYEPQ